MQHLALPLRKRSSGVWPLRLFYHLDQSLNGTLVQPGFSCHDFANCLGEQSRRTVLKESSGNAQPERLYGLGISHSSGDHENPPAEANLSSAGNELETVLLAQVKVQQNKVNPLLTQDVGGFTDRGALSDHLKIGLALNEPAQALAEQSMIVQ